MNSKVAQGNRLHRVAHYGVGFLVWLLLTGCAGVGLVEADVSADGPPPVTSAAAAQRFAEKVVAAGEEVASDDRFTLTVTEEEVTSFLSIGVILLREFQTVPLEDVEQLQDVPGLEGLDELGAWQKILSQRDRLPDLGGRPRRVGLSIEEPAVTFHGTGETVIRGSVRLLVASVPVRIVAAPQASEGELALDFVEGQLGPVPMPEIVFDYLGRRVSRILLAGREYAEFTEIRVGEGVMTLSGRIKR